MNSIRYGLLAASLACAFGSVSQSASAATAAQLNTDGQAALSRLYAQSARAVRYRRDAHAILVFPHIVKLGFIIGGQGGEGVLFVHGVPTAYYKIGAVSYGLQAGGQEFSYALFLMNDKAVAYVNKRHDWAIGAGRPSNGRPAFFLFFRFSDIFLKKILGILKIL